MMQIVQRTERKAFVIWLRTGRWLRTISPDSLEQKFNHNHDPANGRFTGGGGSGGGGASGGRGGEDGAPNTIDQLFGGGGATGRRWDAPVPGRTLSPARPFAAVATRTIAPTVKPTPIVAPKLRHILRNGYDYTIDAQDRTRMVSGTLILELGPRSRRAQAEAGGTDRLPTDDGGHYIAPRFKGPTDAFNHFAQNLSINRGRYRVLEDQWATAKRAGKNVSVRIVPLFDKASRRPSALNILFIIGIRKQSIKLPN